jgi:hypothetical protein
LPYFCAKYSHEVNTGLDNFGAAVRNRGGNTLRVTQQPTPG